MRIITGITGALGFVAAYAGVSTMETALLPGVIVGIIGTVMLIASVALNKSIN